MSRGSPPCQYYSRCRTKGGDRDYITADSTASAVMACIVKLKPPCG